MSPWKLTPRTPDDNMVEAGIVAVAACNEDHAAACTAEHCWPGMWDAAPAVPDAVVERACADAYGAMMPFAWADLAPKTKAVWIAFFRAALAAVGAE